jgi:hypothetical protein
MRPVLARPASLCVSLWAAFALLACQDSYASNSGRDTHMGDVRAAATAPAPSVTPAAPAVPAAAPASSTAPSGNAPAAAPPAPSQR